MLIEVLGSLGWIGSRLWGSALDSFGVANGLFGSIVAVTGDAHQAQVAQDIFRQEVRIERSVRIREDIRDAHKLMIENVQTQLLMGSIVLGICFAVLIEGGPTDPLQAPVVVQELWAVFAVWAISLSFLSVWFALQFQEVVSISARRRLLDKHRVFTPNDEVVACMGGLSLAEKVSQLHQGLLNELARILGSSVGSEAVQESLTQGAAALAQRMLEQLGHDEMRPEQPHTTQASSLDEDAARNSNSDSSLRSSSSLDVLPPTPMPTNSFRSLLSAAAKSETPLPTRKVSSLLDVAVGEGDTWAKPPWEDKGWTPPPRNGEQQTVRLHRGARAWFDDKAQLSNKQIVDAPDFLIDETVVRCNWEMDGKGVLRFYVRGRATLYVAAQWPPPGSKDAFRGQGPPPNWKDEYMPILTNGGSFQRVEGFSILVSEKKMDLPIYRAQIGEPNGNGWCKVKLKFQFPENFEAPLVILRRGVIPQDVCEEDWPVREFMDEMDAIQPLREQSMQYMSHGLMNLLLAAFFAHLGRVLADRPWPRCYREVVVISCALLPGLLFSSSPDRAMRYVLNMHVPRHSLTGRRNLESTGMDAPHAAAASRQDQLETMALADRQVSYQSDYSSTLATEHHQHLGRITSTDSQTELGTGALELPVKSPAVHLEVAELERSLSDVSATLVCCLSGSGNRTRCGATADAAPSNFPLRDDPEAMEDSYKDGLDSVEEADKDPEQLALDIAVGGPMEPLNPDEAVEDDCCENMAPRHCEDVQEQDEDSIISPPARAGTTSCRAFGCNTRLSLPSRCRRCCLQRKSPPIDEKPPTKLVLLRRGVFLLWFSSLFWVVVAWLVRLALDAASRDNTASGDLQAHTALKATSWSVHRPRWPSPFFSPKAAALFTDGVLWVTSDWLLAAVRLVNATSISQLRLAEAADGLLTVPLASAHQPGSGPLLAVASRGGRLQAYDVSRMLAGQASDDEAMSAGLRLLHSFAPDITQLQVGLATDPLPTELGSIVAMSSTLANVADGNSTGVVAVASTSGVYFCTVGVLHTVFRNDGAVDNTSNTTAANRWDVVLRVPELHLPSGVRSLHLSCGATGCAPSDGLVLWIADNSGCLRAMDLASGLFLGGWQLPAAAPTVVLAGNTSHLVAVGRAHGETEPSVFIAPVATLLAGGAAQSACNR